MHTKKRTFAALAVAVLGWAALAAFWTTHADATPKAGPAEIRASRIVLTDEDGREGVTLMASRAGSGVWVTAPNGETASIYGTKFNGAVLSLWANPNEAAASDFGVSARKGEDVVAQVVGKDGRFHFLDAARVVRTAAQPPATVPARPAPAAPAEKAERGGSGLHPLARLAVRAKLRAELQKAGKSRAEVNDLMRHVDDRTIDAAAQEAGAVVAGPVLDWIVAHQDLILAIVKMLLAAFGV